MRRTSIQGKRIAISSRMCIRNSFTFKSCGRGKLKRARAAEPDGGGAPGVGGIAESASEISPQIPRLV